MNEVVANSATMGVVISLIGYAFGVWLKKRYKYAILNPLLISIVVVISFLLFFHVDYEVYNNSAKYLSFLLTPATVCLAIPLYQQIELLKKHFIAIFVGILSGVLSSMGSILALSVLFRLSHENYVTLLPKSITTAIGMGISEELGGNVTITVATIIVTGILGNVIADIVLKLFQIKNPIARGLALGTSSHAIGTAKAMQLGEVEGAMSSLAIVVAGLCTVIGASIFASFY